MDETIDPLALKQMKERHREGTRWAAYRNEDMWRTTLGHLQFLLVGKDCTYAEAPKSFPKDTENGAGYSYLLVGYVNFDTGRIVPT